MYLNGLDELDQKIVELLIENARISYSDIGQKVGISRVAVKARIQALEQKGVIEEYTTVINPQKISGAVSCYFEIETTPSCLWVVTDRLNRSAHPFEASHFLVSLPDCMAPSQTNPAVSPRQGFSEKGQPAAPRPFPHSTHL